MIDETKEGTKVVEEATRVVEEVSEKPDKKIPEKDSVESLLAIEKDSEVSEKEADSILEEENKDKLRIILPTYTPKQLEDTLRNLTKDRARFDKAFVKMGTFENTLVRMVEVFSDQYNLLHDALTKNTKKLDISYEDEEKDIKVKDSFPNMSKNFEGKELSGKEAKIYLLANKKNVKKIMLLNSGFYVLLQCPSLTDLTIMYNKISDQLDEYGRLFGTYFYLYSDLYIKQIMIDMISELVVSSNLKGWRKGKTLLKAISIHDYSTLLHGIASLMFKDGYEFKYQCPYGEYNEIVKIDLNKIKYNNFNGVSESDLQFLSSSQTKTSKEITKYQKSLGLDTTIDLDTYKFHLKVPSLQEYFIYGDSYNKNLMDMVQNGNKEEIQNYLKFSYFKIFTPWIERIDVLNDDKTVNFRLSDIDGKCLILDELQLSNSKDLNKIIDPIVDFIKNTMLTHIVIPLNPCPVCKKIPENTINGFLPLDMQESFFLISTMRLIH